MVQPSVVEVERRGPRCSTCGRRGEERICQGCRTRTAEELGSWPDLLNRLVVAGVKAPAGLGEFVSGGSFGSSSPAADHAVSLLSVTPEALLRAVTRPHPPSSDASVPLWITRWAAVWRKRLGHHQPELPRRQRWNPGEVPAPRVWPDDPGLRAKLLSAELDEHGARVALGLAAAGVRSGVRVINRPPDTIDEAWQARFGGAKPARRLVEDTAYLGTWLDQALDQFDDGPQFVTGLRALYGQARAVVGERSDVVKLGKCPETLTTRSGEPVLDDHGREVLCGAMLLTDPYAARILCRRCGAETLERGRLLLARRIREAWGESAGREAWVA